MTIVINQYTPSITKGDGVSNSLFIIKKLLQEANITSSIYANQIDKTLQHKVKHISSYQPNKNHILLYHYSIYDDFCEKIISFSDKKILIYHNITPHFYFKSHPFLHLVCKKAREQLQQIKEHFIATIADSNYNKKELDYYGYKNTTTIPLLIDSTQERKIDHSILQANAQNYNIIFVGRVTPNKAQHLLIQTLYFLKQKTDLNLKLHLIGAISDQNYLAFIKEQIENLSLSESINLTKKVSHKELNAYYEVADLFLSLSEHEGFCIPLVEAMLSDTPALAYASTAIITTLPKSSLFYQKSPDKVASTVLKTIYSIEKRVAILKEQKKHLKRFLYPNIKKDFYQFLSKTLNIELKDMCNLPKPTQKTCKIEGPFDSNYSLSIVNQNLAKALNSLNIDVKLHSTEGYGDFEPDREFLLAHKDLEMLHKKEISSPYFTLRNLYPPRTNAFRGLYRAIGIYGWEESSFLHEHIELFNTRLTHIFTMSEYVTNVLKSNAITTPIYTVGLGADHVLKTPPKPFVHPNLEGFKLLHISSCFPRKGADTLLEAFKNLKKEGLKLSLIIKTFPNPHSNIHNLIKQLPKEISKDILLIDKDLTSQNINYLYTISDALIAPSKGEGFGLPLAEAMLYDLPVITTAYGGQSDFCTKSTAWLIDFTFQKAKTHFNLFNSYWAKPSLKSLQKQIKTLYNLPKKETNKKTALAKKNILQNYTWKNVAQKIINIIETPQKSSTISLAIISTYNTKCGIAIYTQALTQYFSKKINYTLLANKTDEIIDKKLEQNIIRCWQDRFELSSNPLIKELKTKDFTHILIEFNFAFFSMTNLQNIILQNSDKTIILDLHSVQDVTIEGLEASLSQIIPTLKKVHKIITHSLRDLNTLKEFGIYKNTLYTPLPIQEFKHSYKRQLKLKNLYAIPNKTIISTYGFLLPHKGTLELIKAFKKVKNYFQDTHLLLLNALYPSPISQEYKKECQESIKQLHLASSITLITDFLKLEESKELLSLSSLIVLPYKHTQESSSASAKDALSTLKPLLCSNEPIFEDIQDVSYTITKELHQEIIDFIKLNQHPKLELQKRWIKYNTQKHYTKKIESIMLAKKSHPFVKPESYC